MSCPMETPPEVRDGALLTPATSRLKADELRSARSAARIALKISADWLQKAGATQQEVEALRAAWRALSPA